MTKKEFYKTLFTGQPSLEELAGQKANPLTDYMQLMLMQEIEPLLQPGLPKDKKNDLADNILDILVDLADLAIKIGIDTAAMVFTGADPYKTYTETKKTLSQDTNPTK